jgi:hypothetical protein
VAIIVFSKPVAFPVAPLREQLLRYFPRFKWQCGENDTGAAEQMGSFAENPVILGRSAEEAIMVHCQPFLGAHHAAPVPHEWHLKISQPTTENGRLAQAISALICGISMILDEDHARCQLEEGGSWYSAEEMVQVIKTVSDGSGAPVPLPQTGMAAPDTPAGRYANLEPEQVMALGETDEMFAKLLHERGMGDIAEEMGLSAAPDFAHEGARMDHLPTMVMLANSPLIFDWQAIKEGLPAIDPGGDWNIVESGPSYGRLEGRGATIKIATTNSPVPSYILAQGFARTHGITDADKAAFTAHKVHHTLTIDLDTRAADYVDVRQTTKVATLLIGLAALRHGFAGLYNAGVGALLTVDAVKGQMGVLASDEVPISMWTWWAFDSVEPENVSLSTNGMRPFTGYEVELWNAPGALDAVADRLNGVIRYLLINGPVIKHGDTIGDNVGDRSTRCFHGTTRANRPEQDLPVLLIELDNMTNASTPQPDAPVPGAFGDQDPLAQITEQRSIAPEGDLSAIGLVEEPASFDAPLDPPVDDLPISDLVEGNGNLRDQDMPDNSGNPPMMEVAPFEQPGIAPLSFESAPLPSFDASEPPVSSEPAPLSSPDASAPPAEDYDHSNAHSGLSGRDLRAKLTAHWAESDDGAEEPAKTGFFKRKLSGFGRKAG